MQIIGPFPNTCHLSTAYSCICLYTCPRDHVSYHSNCLTLIRPPFNQTSLSLSSSRRSDTHYNPPPMAMHLPRYRLPQPPPPHPTLIQTSSITLITLTSNTSPSPTTSIHPNLPTPLPLSLHLPNIPLPTLLSLPAPLIATTIHPSPNRLTLTPTSLLLSLSPSTYHSLGLPTRKTLRPPNSLPSHQLKHPSWIPIQLPRNPPSTKLLHRLQWALHPSRIGAPDVLITGPNAHIQSMARKHQTAPIPLSLDTRTFPISKAETPVLSAHAHDHCAIVNMADAIQRVACCNGFENHGSDVMVHRSRYVGFCGGDVGERAVECMRAWIKENGDMEHVLGGVVLLRGVAHGVAIWQQGRVRGDGWAGFEADSAEMFVWGARGGHCVVQMRAGVDYAG